MPVTQLEPGQDNIDQRRVTGDPKNGYRIQWSVRLYDGRTVKKSITLKNATKGEVKRRARQKTEELLQTSGDKGRWSQASKMSDYIRKSSIKAVMDASLRGRTKDTYAQKLGLLADRLEGYTIHDGSRISTLQQALNDIATEHGTATARQCRKVANKWVMQRLVFDGVLGHNPMAGVTIDITVENVGKKKPSGGVALTEGEYTRALKWMLGLDPEIPKPRRGRYTQEQVTAKRAAVIDMTLLQATTGLRIGECRSLMPSDIKERDGETWVTVRKEVSKTHRGREVPILDARVAGRIKRLRKAQKASEWLFPSPIAKSTRWDKSNLQKAVTGFLREVGEACDIPALSDHSSHIWRATLSTLAMKKGMPAEIRAAYFGHTAEVNRNYYTDTTDITPFIDAMRR